ncbi:mechanosensitive ion channel family protein [Amylibacter sp. SFDW26]|uniref:mechanosensitive ion channel family protein n=1 Tax=Amylibacter sp. SFDW26 TaxID=2652722 RepID=UPI0012619D94|nr:mechanosensitive ion channel family protein [Amylibacter sp. SFDW26]KAB7616003.1 mechanosensitive ion channel family protein [Amylibacter sp. SFDW26]
MHALFIRFITVFILLIGMTFSVHAQSSTLFGAVNSGSDGAKNVSTEFVDLMKEAVENGVKVIVVDTNGEPLTTSPETPDLAKEDADTMSGIMKAQVSAVKFRETLFDRLRSLPKSFEEVVYILKATSPTGKISAYLDVLIKALLLFLVGYIVERQLYLKYVKRSYLAPAMVDEPVGYTEKLPVLVKRFVLRIIGVLISMLVAYMLGTTIFGQLNDPALQFTVTLINAAYAASRFVALLWRMILVPYLEKYRIARFSNQDARRLYHWLWITAAIDITTILFDSWVFELGLTYDVFALISAISSLFIVMLNICLIIANYDAISRAIRNGLGADEAGRLNYFVSYSWAYLAVGYLIFAWVELVYRLVLEIPLSMPLILGAYAILISIIVVYACINYVIERLFQRAAKMEEINSAMKLEAETALEGEGDTAAEEAMKAMNKHRMTSFSDLAQRVAGILAFVAGVWALITIWNVEDGLASNVAINRWIDVVAILFIGYIIYHMFRIWIDSKIEEEGGDAVEVEPGDEGGASGASRLATLLPLFRNFILVVVVVTIALIALLEMGINVSPLFAGAGVAGLAIGFGAQTLVRDIFSGAFFLVDDAFRKGEYIDVGDVKGTVEKISVRSFQLRHHLGPLHTIPFGEIQVLTNYSRDWVMMKLPLRVTYDTDVERVRKLIKKLGIELMEDPVIGENFLQPLKSQGVIEMQDSAMIIRVKFMTKPGDQWTIRKRVFQEIRDLFEREGIKFAHREVTVRLADDTKTQNLTDAQKKAIAGAAQSALDEDALEGGASDNDNGE